MKVKAVIEGRKELEEAKGGSVGKGPFGWFAPGFSDRFF